MGISQKKLRPRFPDSKDIHRALFGAYYEEDVYDKYCGLMPRAMRIFQWRIEEPMRRRNLIFVHVPRVAGTSIARTSIRMVKPESARYLQLLRPHPIRVR